MNAFVARFAVSAFVVAFANYVQAAQVISYTGDVVVEDFDALGPEGASAPFGWFVGWHNGYPPGTAGAMVRDKSITINPGTVAPGGPISGFNCGTNDASAGLDRSLGIGATATSSPNGTNRFIEVQIENNSGTTLRAINVTYTGKQWRTSSSSSGQAFTNYLQYGTNGVDFVFMGPAFDFRGPVTGPANTPINGNLSANSIIDLGGTYALPTALPPGGIVFLRWLDVNDPSTDPVLAIDNFSFIGLTNVPQVLITNGDFAYTFSVFAGMTDVSGTNNGTGTSAQFSSAHAMAADRQGNLYIADTGNQLIRKITPLAEVSTFAGLAGVTGTNNGTGSQARFNLPEGICVDGDGNVFVSEINNHTIRKITPAGVVTTVAGLAGTSGTNDGNGSAARFHTPVTVQVDNDGFLYVGDFNNHTIRKISPAGDVSTLAGLADVPGARNGSVAEALFRFPHTCLPDGFGNVYVADLGNQAIRKISAEGFVSTFAGLPGSSGTNDGTGTLARFAGPWGLAFEETGNLLVTDRENNTIRRIAPDGTVKTIGGVARVQGSADGHGTRATFSRPRGITTDPNGNLFVVDTANETIRIGRPDPALQVFASNGQIIVSWPSWTTNYQLENSGDLPISWSPVSGPVVMVGGRNFLTNSPTEAALFFRLRSR